MGCFGDIPDPPDPAESYRAGVLANLQTFPMVHDVEAAARLGQPVTVTLPNGQRRTFDFSGLGDAQYQGAYQDRMAQTLLDLQQQLGPQFVQQRLAELQAADPESFQLRNQLYGGIMSDLEGARDASRPTADALQQSILDELNRGGQLDAGTTHQISQGVLGGQVARGNYLGNAPASEEAGAMAGASENAAAQRKAAALQFLTSGATPEDVNYRRTEQALSNLGSFASGQSPVAQFGQLSGAGNGAVPFEGGGPLPGLNQNAGAQGMQFANGVYSGQAQLAQQNVNPWLGGLTGGIQGLNIWSSLGGRFGSPASAPTYQNQGS